MSTTWDDWMNTRKNVLLGPTSWNATKEEMEGRARTHKGIQLFTYSMIKRKKSKVGSHPSIRDRLWQTFLSPAVPVAHWDIEK